VHRVRRERETGRRANGGAIAVGPVRVGGDADLGARTIEILGGEELAVRPHRRQDLPFDHLCELGTEPRGGVAAGGVVERRALDRRRKDRVDFAQGDFDIVTGGRIATPQPFPMVRGLRRDVGGNGVPAREHLAPGFVGAHPLECRERRDRRQPAATDVRHAPQLVAAHACRHRAFDRVAHDPVGDPLRSVCQSLRIDALEHREPGVLTVLPARERGGRIIRQAVVPRIRHTVERRFVGMLREVGGEIRVGELADADRQRITARLQHQREGQDHDLR